jgi:hypothetical protein
MSIALSTQLQTTFEDAVTRTRQALSDHGFGVLTGIHSCQCVGTTARWITAAPSEAIAASRAASLLSVFFAALGAISPMMTWPVDASMK